MVAGLLRVCILLALEAGRARAGLRGCAGLASGGALPGSSMPSPGLGRVDPSRVRRGLLGELEATGRGPRPARLEALRDRLRPTFAALPRNQAHPDRLVEKVARYALHRYFVEQYSWHVAGLALDGDLLNSSSASVVSQATLLDERLRGRGACLHELAALTAAVEDLARAEAVERLLDAYALQRISPDRTRSNAMAELIQNTFMLVWADPWTDFSGWRPHHAQWSMKQMKSTPEWSGLEPWIRDLDRSLEEESRATSNPFSGVSHDVGRHRRFAEGVAEHFGGYVGLKCQALKDVLASAEQEPGSGRVRLSRFYQLRGTVDWAFEETLADLRRQGALDETDGQHPSVVIPNYMRMQSNCVSRSRADLLRVCCPDQCMALMAQLERKAAEPTVPASRLAGLVAALPSDTASAPRELPTSLLERLEAVARRHDGRVPLHGRLFAQWMHHAYPLECPYPRSTDGSIAEPLWRRDGDDVSGWGSNETLQALLGDAEAAEEGLRDARASTGPASVAGPFEGGADAAFAHSFPLAAGLPWTEEELLLASTSPAAADAAAAAAAATASARAALRLGLQGLGLAAAGASACAVLRSKLRALLRGLLAPAGGGKTAV